MIKNKNLRLHVVNVGHGDAILIEFPDKKGGGPRFGLVDAGGRGKDNSAEKTLGYLKAFLEYRNEGQGYSGEFEFLCLTHPHHDHYYGMLPVLEWAVGAGIPPTEFWDCGFRYNTLSYLKILKFLCDNADVIQFTRVASGTEFHFGPVEVLVLAPSVDLRNRYDSYGVDVNDGSIVLRVRKSGGTAILAGDAHFDSWGKVCEEYPRTKHLTYPPVKDSEGKLKADVRNPDHPDLIIKSKVNQLGCNLLKVAHHGSKRGTSFEYLEKLGAKHYAITCAKDSRYAKDWKGKFPHPLTRMAIKEQDKPLPPGATAIPDLAAIKEVGMSSVHGSMIYTIQGNGVVKRKDLGEASGRPVSRGMLEAVLP